MHLSEVSALAAEGQTAVALQGGSFACWLGWVFCADNAILNEIVPRRAKAVAEDVLDSHRPEVWISDRYAGQQDLAATHQVCPAHVLRDVQYAIVISARRGGDEAFAPKLRDLLRWAIGVGKRRDGLKDSTLASYLARTETRLDNLLAVPAAHKAGQKLQRQIKAWRTKLFVLMTDRRVPATNNTSEHEVRPSVAFRKVTGGFRSNDGADTHAGYRTLTSTARLTGKTALDAVFEFVGQALGGGPQDRGLPTT